VYQRPAKGPFGSPRPVEVPVGVRHAVAPKSPTTACGLDIVPMHVFTRMPFGEDGDTCSECLAIVNSGRETARDG